MAINAGDVIRATAKLLSDTGDSIQNVFHFKAGAYIAADNDGISDITAFLDALYDNIDTDLHLGMDFDSINLFNVDQDKSYGDIGWPSLTSCTGSGERYAPGVCLLVSLRTGYSRKLGRKYLGFFGEGKLSSGIFAGSVVTNALAFAADLLGSFTGGTSGESWLPGIPTKEGGFLGFTEGLVNTNPAYQRRRRIGSGV
jgi:hypothetical protein